MSSEPFPGGAGAVEPIPEAQAAPLTAEPEPPKPAESAPAPAPAPVAAPQRSTVVVEQKAGRGLITRAIYYVFVGWWLTGIVVIVAYVAALTVIGLPLAVYLINHIPTTLTLRPHTERYEVTTQDGVVTGTRRVGVKQTNILVRIVYFFLVGWWLGAIWSIVAYALALTVIGIPLALVMFNRLPRIFSLHRGYT